MYIADGWLLFVALSEDGVLFKLGVRSVAVEWQLWAVLVIGGWLLVVSLSVDGVLFKLMVRAGAVGWQLWMALMVDVVLFGVGLKIRTASTPKTIWVDMFTSSTGCHQRFKS